MGTGEDNNYPSMRKKEIRLSDDEKNRLRKLRNKEFGPEVPYGYVVSELIDEEFKE